jgi:hypothetical protein
LRLTEESSKSRPRPRPSTTHQPRAHTQNPRHRSLRSKIFTDSFSQSATTILLANPSQARSLPVMVDGAFTMNSNPSEWEQLSPTPNAQKAVDDPVRQQQVARSASTNVQQGMPSSHYLQSPTDLANKGVPMAPTYSTTHPSARTLNLLRQTQAQRSSLPSNLPSSLLSSTSMDRDNNASRHTSPFQKHFRILTLHTTTNQTSHIRASSSGRPISLCRPHFTVLT